MDYKVLYRKYRPSNFSNVIDQNYITTILKNSILNNKISHAYIFSGPRGTGKTTTAKIFAKAINCENITDSGPCNECNSCKNFINNPDIIELDAASNNGVDEIREIIDNVRVVPTYSKYKVYIIDEVHMLTTNAFNALLLTLEEPPKNVVFILATTNIENVPITILSRCQRFDFKKISIDSMIERLNYVCKEENILCDEAALKIIAKLADGSLRDALSILDQLTQENSSITSETVEQIFGIVPSSLINNVINNFVDNNKIGLIDSIDNLRKLGLNYKSLIKTTIDILRKLSIDSLQNNSDESYLRISRTIISLNDTLNNLNVYVDPIILYEIAFLTNLCAIEDNLNNEKKAKVINNDNNFNISNNNDIENQNYFPGNNFDDDNLKTKILIRVNNCLVNPQKIILENVKKRWKNFIDSINDNNLLSLIVDILPVCGSDNYFIFSTNNNGTSELINLNATKFENTFNQFFEFNCKIVVLVSSEWEKYKNKYINDLKKGVKYKMMSDVSDNENEKVINNDIFALAGDVFDSNKIQYE